MLSHCILFLQSILRWSSPMANPSVRLDQFFYSDLSIHAQDVQLKPLLSHTTYLAFLSHIIYWFFWFWSPTWPGCIGLCSFAWVVHWFCSRWTSHHVSVSSVGGKISTGPTNEDINSSNLFQWLIASILQISKFDIVIYLLYRQIFVFHAIRERVGTVSVAGAFLARCFAHVTVDPNYQMKSETLVV
jgi:hypothetical protein